MSQRTTDYKQRRDLVLGIVVGEYIKTVSPVSSGFIMRDYLSGISSATIRNILAELEEEGFLTHPHTSAGRVPTQEGYRYYVDNLMNEIQLLEEEKERIRRRYEKERKDLEAILEKTSEVISDLTQYTSIISIDGCDDKIFCRGTSYVVEYPDSNDISKIKSILSALEEKERILKVINRKIEKRIKIYIGYETACSQIDNCSLAVSKYRAKNGLSGRIAILGPTRMKYPRVVSALDYFSNLIEDIL